MDNAGDREVAAYRLSFYFIFKFFKKFFDLWVDDDLTVWGCTVVFEVILMIIFGFVEFSKGYDFCDDFVLEFT